MTSVPWGDIIVAVILLVISVPIIRRGSKRMDDLDENKMDVIRCGERHLKITEDLKKGDEKFKDLQVNMREQRDLLISLGTKMDLMLDNKKKT